MRTAVPLIALMCLASVATAAASEAGEDALVAAAEARDFGALQKLVRRRVDPDQRTPDGTTALHWAARWDDLQAARVLLKAGASVDATTELGATPLYLAALNGSAPMIDLLLRAGADVDRGVVPQGQTPLMFAARGGNTAAIDRLLAAGAGVNAADSYRATTALMWAAERDNVEAVRLLLHKGAAIDAASAVSERTTSGKAPPPRAKRAPSGASSGDDVDPPADDGAPRMKEPQGGVTALVLAARQNALRSATALLDAGAPVDQRSGDGSTALLVAVQNANLEMARLLIARGADVSIPNLKGWSPLYLAVKNRTMEVGTMPAPPHLDRRALFEFIELLVDKGAAINARVKADTEMRNAIKATWLNEAGATPFLRASLCGDLEVMKLLLTHGADPLIATEDGTTALAALAGVGFTKGFMEDIAGADTSLEAMKLLIAAGIDVNAANKDHTTALHGAAHKNFAAAIELLVAHGADPTAVSQRRGTFERSKEFKGNTVLDYAYGVQTGGESSVFHPEAVALLERLLKEKGLPRVRNGVTDGGVAAKLVGP